MVHMDTGEGRGRGYSTSNRGGGGYYSSNRGRGGGYSSSNRGGYGGNQFNPNYYQQNASAGRGGGYWGGRGRRGRGGRGGYPSGNRSHVLPQDVEFVSDLKGHRKKVTCMCLDPGSGQLFTGSHDQTVRVWNCQSGECQSTVQVGGEVDSILIEGGFLFVGLKTVRAQGQIRIWNMSTMQDIILDGHVGQVSALAAANGMLFSGGQDKSIRVWKMNPASGAFECAAVLEAAGQDGHRASVSCMCTSGPFLFSGDTAGTIKVWDLEAGVVKQTLIKAHRKSQHPAIMSLLIWEGHLMSGSLDGEIKIWEPADPATGNVVNPSSIYVYPEQEESQQQGRGRGRSYSSRGPQLNGVLCLCGVADLEGKAVLMVSYNSENAIRLFELPTFVDRGSLSHVQNARALTGFPQGNLMISGDEFGKVKIWRWKAPQQHMPS